MRRTHVALAAVVAVLVASGIAAAAIPGTDGVIQGCYDTRTGALRVIDAAAGETCTRREAELSWAQQGPQGLPGVPGEDGADGAPGPAGPDLAAIEDLADTACRVGEPDEGVVEVGYGPATAGVRPIQLSCAATTLHQLRVDKTPLEGGGTVTGGGVDCGETCDVSLRYGTSVTLVANAFPGYQFTGWTGDCSGFQSCTLTMDSDHTVGAGFVRMFTLTVNLQFNSTSFATAGYTIGANPGHLLDMFNSGSCTVTTFLSINTCTATYAEGTEVTLSKEFEQGLTAFSWGPSTVCSGSGTCTVTMDGNRTVFATGAG